MEKFKLKIVATSDIHGYIMPLKYADNSDANIGLAKISALVNQLRQIDEVLLIDNGDILQGSPLAYYNAQINKADFNPFSAVLNEMKYDACIVGNHDFNYGISYLESYQNALNCPLLSCNITYQDKEAFKSYTIKTLANGLKIAIIGATTKYIPNWERYETIKDLEFKDSFEETKKVVKFIKDNEQVDCIIVSYHGGFERDLETSVPTEDLTGENQGYELLSIDGIDVLITGHQHRSIHYNNLFNKAVTQTANNGQEVASIELDFEKTNHKWHIVKKETELLKTDKVEPDQHVIDLIQAVEKNTQNWLDQPLGTVKNGDLIIHDLFDAKVNKHPLITFINQVQMEAGDVDISVTSLANEIYGFNHEITMRNIISTYVFPNTLVILEVSGQDILDALEKSANYFVMKNELLSVNEKYLFPKPQHYNYDMYDGIEYEIHVREESGHKIKNLMYKGKPIELEKNYHVIMNNYRANGGGNFNMYKNKKRIKEITTDMVELLANYVKEHREIEISNKENIKIIY